MHWIIFWILCWWQNLKVFGNLSLQHHLDNMPIFHLNLANVLFVCHDLIWTYYIKCAIKHHPNFLWYHRSTIDAQLLRLRRRLELLFNLLLFNSYLAIEKTWILSKPQPLCFNHGFPFFLLFTRFLNRIVVFVVELLEVRVFYVVPRHDFWFELESLTWIIDFSQITHRRFRVIF